MGIHSDKWIREKAINEHMIEPFAETCLSQVISYGLSSYGYDMRIADEYKIFTDVFNTLVDPKNFNEKSFVEYKGEFCIIPPHSFALARSYEKYNIPRDCMAIVLGKSTYARCGIIVNVTPLEPCYDKNTEILTKDGWKKFEDLKEDEIVATLNPTTKKLEYQEITAKQKFNFEGDLIQIKGRNIDLLVTPAHQLYIKNRYREDFEFIRADMVYGKYNYELKRDCNWEGKDKKFFALPITEINKRFENEGEIIKNIIKLLKERPLTRIEIAKRLSINYNSVGFYLKILSKKKVIEKSKISKPRKIGANQYSLYTLKNSNYSFIEEKMEPIKIIMDDWLRFLGFWLAEGSTTICEKKRGYIVRLANFHPKIIETVDGWLRQLPFHHLRIDTGFLMQNKQLCLYLRQFGKARQKFVPNFVKDLPPDKIKIFLDSFMLGDGNLETNTFFTSSKRLADDLQELILKAGWTSIVRTVKDELPHMLKGKIIKANGDRYVIRISKIHLTPKIYPRSFSGVPYNDFVYDVTVPNHTLYVRRNGKPCWSSNCWKGFITIEISNTTPLPVKIYSNEGIAQVLFFQGEEPCEVSYADKHGKYMNQVGIVLPKIKK